ncbi:MAG: hypothetical protein ACO3CQ_06350, partial [Candidatus Nanopelagicaceae bacterium]
SRTNKGTPMTEEQILELASQHLYCNVSVVEWSGKSEDILNFARAIYEEGYDDGCYRATNSTGYTGLFGEPQ